MFFDTFKMLCEEKGISCNKAALENGLSNATPTKWKNTGATPQGDTLTTIAQYFDVPLALLLRQPPFDNWDRINEDRKKFITQSGVDKTILQIIFGIDPEHPETATISTFSRFVNLAVKSVALDNSQNWIVEVGDSFAKKSVGATLRQKKESVPASCGGDDSQNPAFFRLRKGLEPYNISEADSDFLIAVYKAHIKKNQQE